jgi:hypothetical protein
MQVELYCCHCHTHFAAPKTPAGEVLERLSEEGPWCALGDGETVEDHISNALTDQEPIACPVCGEAVTLDEPSLARFAQEMLTHW